MNRLTCLKRGHALRDLRVRNPAKKRGVVALYTCCRRCGMTIKRGEATA